MKNNTRKILLALLLVFAMLASLVTVTAFAEESDDSASSTVTIYFENNWLWTEVCCHYFGSATIADTEYPGVAMTKVGTLNAHEVYSASVPADATSIVISGIKNNGSGERDKTPDISTGIVDGAAWRMVWADANFVEEFSYDPNAPVDPAPDVSGNTYTVAGVGGLCGSEWDVADTYNDMTLNAETGLYEKTFTGIAAGDYECKVALNHSWDQSWGTEGNGEFGNYSFSLFEEQNVTITFDPKTNEVKHQISASTGPDTNRPSGPSADFDNCDKITLYVGDSALWDTVFVHAWIENGNQDIAYTSWPGLEMEWDGEKLLYYIELPSICDSVVFNCGSNEKQSADLIIPGDGAFYDNGTGQWGDIKNYTPPIPPENTTEDVTVYVKDTAGWGQVSIYYWNVEGIDPFDFPGIPMELGEDGYYYATVPAGYWGVVFSNGGDWQQEGSLLQTPDLIIPTNGKVYLHNGHECLYNDGTADDNDGWFSLGDNGQGDDTPDGPADGDNGDEPAKEMTLIQKLAKALLLFLRSIEDFFNGLFKK